MAGAGAAGTAIVTLLLAAGAKDVVVWDREGCLSADDDSLPPAKAELAGRTNPRQVTGDLRAGLEGADVFIGVSGPGVLEAEWIRDMAEKPIVFALANPDPEIDPAEAGQYAAVVASGRSDYPNQINNVLAFPGVFRGLLDARASDVTIEMLLRAAEAIAHVVTDDELNASYIIPSVFDEKVPEGRGRRDPRRRGVARPLGRREPRGGAARTLTRSGLSGPRVRFEPTSGGSSGELRTVAGPGDLGAAAPAAGQRDRVLRSGAHDPDADARRHPGAHPGDPGRGRPPVGRPAQRRDPARDEARGRRSRPALRDR